MSHDISNTDDTIYSRDVIERLEELQAELIEARDDSGSTTEIDVWINDMADDENGMFQDAAKEYMALQSLAGQGEQYAPDWNYGEQLIRDSYFESAMDEMVADCYELPKDLPSWMIVTYDYDALRQDYTEIDFDGVAYLIR